MTSAYYQAGILLKTTVGNHTFPLTHCPAFLHSGTLNFFFFFYPQHLSYSVSYIVHLVYVWRSLSVFFDDNVSPMKAGTLVALIADVWILSAWNNVWDTEGFRWIFFLDRWLKGSPVEISWPWQPSQPSCTQPRALTVDCRLQTTNFYCLKKQ